MCRYRSPVLSACHAFVRIARVPMRYGGAVSRRVVMLSLPRPLTTVGKKVVTVPADVKPYVVARRSQAFGSLAVCVSWGYKGERGRNVLHSEFRTVQECLLFAVYPVIFSDVFV